MKPNERFSCITGPGQARKLFNLLGPKPGRKRKDRNKEQEKEQEKEASLSAGQLIQLLQSFELSGDKALIRDALVQQIHADPQIASSLDPSITSPQVWQQIDSDTLMNYVNRASLVRDVRMGETPEGVGQALGDLFLRGGNQRSEMQGGGATGNVLQRLIKKPQMSFDYSTALDSDSITKGYESAVNRAKAIISQEKPDASANEVESLARQAVGTKEDFARQAADYLVSDPYNQSSQLENVFEGIPGVPMGGPADFMLTNPYTAALAPLVKGTLSVAGDPLARSTFGFGRKGDQNKVDLLQDALARKLMSEGSYDPSRGAAPRVGSIAGETAKGVLTHLPIVGEFIGSPSASRHKLTHQFTELLDPGFFQNKFLNENIGKRRKQEMDQFVDTLGEMPDNIRSYIQQEMEAGTPMGLPDYWTGHIERPEYQSNIEQAREFASKKFGSPDTKAGRQAVHEYMSKNDPMYRSAHGLLGWNPLFDISQLPGSEFIDPSILERRQEIKRFRQQMSEGKVPRSIYDQAVSGLGPLGKSLGEYRSVNPNLLYTKQDMPEQPAVASGPSMPYSESNALAKAPDKPVVTRKNISTSPRIKRRGQALSGILGMKTGEDQSMFKVDKNSPIIGRGWMPRTIDKSKAPTELKDYWSRVRSYQTPDNQLSAIQGNLFDQAGGTAGQKGWIQQTRSSPAYQRLLKAYTAGDLSRSQLTNLLGGGSQAKYLRGMTAEEGNWKASPQAIAQDWMNKRRRMRTSMQAFSTAASQRGARQKANPWRRYLAKGPSDG